MPVNYEAPNTSTDPAIERAVSLTLLKAKVSVDKLYTPTVKDEWGGEAASRSECFGKTLTCSWVKEGTCEVTGKLAKNLNSGKETTPSQNKRALTRRRDFLRTGYT